MTFARPLLFVLVVLLSVVANPAFAADEKAQSHALVSQQGQTTDPELFGRNSAGGSASDLFFLKGRPRLDFTIRAGRARSAVLNGTDCYTMRMYKVKRKEHFANGESGLRGYSTCELASNYQVRTAIAHVQTIEGNDSQIIEPQK